MLYLTNEDKMVVTDCYKSFLKNLQCFIDSYHPKNWLECYAIVVNMLRAGQFCIDQTIDFNVQFNYLPLPNMENIGAQVMFGICCCRHANTLVNDILQLLGFTTQLQYIFIDENKSWHRSHPSNANHVVIDLKDGESNYLLDAFNNFAFKIESNQSLTPLDVENINIPVEYSTYCDSSIQNIGTILKKYYSLQRMGINHIYDYNY